MKTNKTYTNNLVILCAKCNDKNMHRIIIWEHLSLFVGGVLLEKAVQVFSKSYLSHLENEKNNKTYHI